MSKSAPIPSEGDSDLTPLISRLANEFYSGKSPASPVSALPTTGNTTDVPPVYPTFDPLNAPTRQSEIPALDPGSDDTYAFGEPHRYFDPNDLARPAHSGNSAPAYTGPEYYFLPTSAKRVSPSPVGLPTAVPGSPTSAFDVEAVRRDFPALHQKVNGKPLIWLDNAATTHKPQSVIDATSRFYGRDNSNIHRAAHTLAARATDLFEGGREKVRHFIGATDAKEVIFLRGTTEAINLVAQSYGRQNIGAGDEIIITTIEHHANIVPWQLLSEQTGAVLRVAPVNERGEVLLEQFAALFSNRTKLVSVTHVANSLGTINPVEEMIALAHAFGVPVLLDAAQSAPHLPLDVKALDVDFLALSGHKVFGPTGIGILYGKSHLLENMPPWQGGGHMIKDVTFTKTTYQNAPEKFEAGTPDIAGVVGLAAAVDYLQNVGLPSIAAYEHELLEYATPRLLEVPALKIIGTAVRKASVLSFTVTGHDPEKIGVHLDQHGIAARAGHHCAQPALRRFGVEKTVRASLAFYNTREEVDALVKALHALPKP